MQRSKLVSVPGVARLASVAALLATVLSGGVPTASAAPTLGSWRQGPGSQGDNTYIGRIETPRSGQGIRQGADLLVSGWAVDTTATGWAGFDAVSVWNGAQPGGTKLADGNVGLPRPDVRDALGAADWTNSGFAVTIPNSALANMQSANLYVYLHTPSKGSWFKTATVQIQPSASANLPFPTDPVVYIASPIPNDRVSLAQPINRFVFTGFALDRNPVTNANQGLGPCGSGVDRIQLYLDGKRGDHDTVALGTIGGCASIGVNGQLTIGPAGADFSNFPYLSRSYGKQFDLAGWAFGWNPTNSTPGLHTLYVYARSSITGRESLATDPFYIVDTGNGPCSVQPNGCGNIASTAPGGRSGVQFVTTPHTNNQ